MNLTKLFKTQRELDAKILLQKGLEGQDLLDKKILALQVELGELANEWRGFKFWKEDNRPRTKARIYNKKKQVYEDGNPLLEEYVDVLHFILSIGNDINIYKFEYVELIDFTNNITAQFNSVFQLIGNWKEEYLYMNKENYFTVVNEFLCLGKMLGFTREQIEQAYFKKNEINHQRQSSGY